MGVASVAVGVLAAALLPSGIAHAESRPQHPQAITFAHTVVHYDDANTTVAAAEQAGADIEGAWAKLVAGGGGAGNLGFRRPPGDGAAGGGTDLVDVYLGPLPGWPGLDGGVVLHDDRGKPFVIVARPGRNLLAHEFMHTIQSGYGNLDGVLMESTANWASNAVYPVKRGGRDPEWSLAQERLPFDCAYGTWPATGGRPCGGGYRRDLFLDHASRWVSVDLVRRAFEIAETLAPGAAGVVLADLGAEGLRRAIAEAGGDMSALFLRHVIALNDHTRSPIDLSGYYTLAGAPGAKIRVAGNRLADDPAGSLARRRRTTTGSIALPHLAWRTVRFRGNAGAVRRGDRLRVTLRAAGFTPRGAPQILTVRRDGRRPELRRMTPAGAGRWALTLAFSQAEAFNGHALVLVNDSLDNDAARFSWRAKIVARRKRGASDRRR